MELYEKVFAEKSDIKDGVSREFLEETIKKIADKTLLNIERFDGKFPYYGEGNRYVLKGNEHWGSGYWTAWLWQLYKVTGDERFRKTAESHYDCYSERFNKPYIHCHDVGVIYDLAAVRGYEVTGEKKWKNLALRAASVLTARFHKDGNYLQAWGPAFTKDPAYCRTIIDSLCCIPLWFWAEKEMDEPVFGELARTQADTVLKYLIRDDWSSGHTMFFDPETGAPVRVETHQGASDDSTWSRGEAWGIMGYPIAYEQTGDPKYLKTALNMLAWWVEHTDESLMPAWDFDRPDEERDSSALATAVNGMVRLSRLESLDAETRKVCRVLAERAMKTLIVDYGTMDDPEAWGLLREGVYSKPGNRGVNEFMIWGDYYFLEALVMMLED